MRKAYMQNSRSLEFVNFYSHLTFPKMVLQREGNSTSFHQSHEIGNCGYRIPALPEAHSLMIQIFLKLFLELYFQGTPGSSDDLFKKKKKVEGSCFRCHQNSVYCISVLVFFLLLLLFYFFTDHISIFKCALRRTAKNKHVEFYLSWYFLIQ